MNNNIPTTEGTTLEQRLWMVATEGMRQARRNAYKPEDFELMDTSQCPKHGCPLEMNVYKDVDAGRDCPKCRRERYGNAFVEQALKEMES